MSYCRWSSDDYQCDVYTWEDVSGGWVTCVAGGRYVFTEPLPEPVDLPHPFTDEQFHAWSQRHDEVMRIVGAARTEPIGLAHAGARFHDDTPAACAQTLTMLRDAGYHVPQYAIDALLEEAEQVPA